MGDFGAGVYDTIVYLVNHGIFPAKKFHVGIKQMDSASKQRVRFCSGDDTHSQRKHSVLASFSQSSQNPRNIQDQHKTSNLHLKKNKSKAPPHTFSGNAIQLCGRAPFCVEAGPSGRCERRFPDGVVGFRDYHVRMTAHTSSHGTEHGARAVQDSPICAVNCQYEKTRPCRQPEVDFLLHVNSINHLRRRT